MICKVNARRSRTETADPERNPSLTAAVRCTVLSDMRSGLESTYVPLCPLDSLHCVLKCAGYPRNVPTVPSVTAGTTFTMMQMNIEHVSVLTWLLFRYNLAYVDAGQHLTKPLRSGISLHCDPSII